MQPIDFAAVFASSPNALMMLDRDLRYVAMSREYLRVTGSKESELLGRTFYEVFPHDPANPNNGATALLRDSFLRVIAQRQRDVVALIHYRVPRGEGLPAEDRYWSATHTPIFGSDREVAFVLQHTTDVTDIQRLRERASLVVPDDHLSASANGPVSTLEAGIIGRAREVQVTNVTLGSEIRMLRAMFEQAPGFMCFLRGPDHVFEIYNESYLQLVGDRPLLGMTVRDALPETDTQGYIALLNQVYRTGVAFIGRGMKAQFIGPGGALGSERLIDFVYQPIVDDAHRVVGIFLQGQDITEQKRLETEREQLAALVAQSTDLIAMATPDLKLAYMNEAGQRMLGLPRDTIDSARFLDCFVAADATFVETTVLPRVLDRGHWEGELRYKSTSTNESIDAHCNVFALRDPTSGELRGVATVSRDIRVEKARDAERVLLLQREQAARLEAENANRLKDEFLATVSHELRTPLTAMLGWVRMMRTGQLSPERQERGLETVERNARAQAQLIDDLLDVSRILSGKLLLSVAPVTLAHIVEASLESARPAADAKRITLHPVLDSAAHVMGDSGRLQQIIWNLLSNAVKFTPSGGRVRVVVEQIGSHVHVTVSDSGQGIAPEFLPHVFERFRQEQGSITRTHGGLGLGLAIVKHLVELHGGTVTVASDGPSKGTTFTVRLPVALARSLEISRPPRAPHVDEPDVLCPPELDGLRIMVVEDEPDTRELLAEILAHCGAIVETFESAAAATASFGRVRPSVLISDIGMPNEDGYTLIRRIRTFSPEDGGRTPAIALTAFARTEDRTRALRSGFNAHVPKPIDVGELVAVIASIVPHDDAPPNSK